MLVVAFLKIGPTSTAAQMLAASRVLRDGGVAGVGFLDAQDLGVPLGALESSTLATLVALETPGIGVIGTQSALYGYPFHTARRFATLDHFSAGFSGWLMRTSSTGPEAHAYDWRSDSVAEHDVARAGEHAEIGFLLWDSWEDGAQWPDKETGNFKDDSRIHPIHYVSDRFQVEGPLDVPPSPQRRPVVLATITAPAEVAALSPWVDVAVAKAPDAEQTAALVGAAQDDGGIAKVLIASDTGGLDVAAATSLAQSLGADGVAPFIDTSEVGAVAALASPDQGACRTFAERLGLGALTVGGRIA